MGEVAHIIIRPVIDHVVSSLIKNIGYVEMKKHFKNMETKMEHLDQARADAEHHKEANMVNNREIPSGLLGWLQDVATIKKDYDSILWEDVGCLNLKMRYRIGRKAFQISHTIDELLNSLWRFNWTDAPIPMGRVDSKPTPWTPRPLLPSRKKPFTDALKFLQQDDNNGQVIALCGCGGVGKTTMMEQLKQVAEDMKMFDWIVRVSIGMYANTISIQNDISMYLCGQALPEMTVTARADRLSMNFKAILNDRKQKLLVIFDDVWEELELKHMGLTSPLANGVKLLLTSRDSNICAKIANQVGSSLKLVEVAVLEEADAYNLFSQITGISKEEDPEMYQVGCDIVNIYDGLPLAIQIAGQTLKHKYIYVWRDYLHRLKQNYIDETLQNMVKISYENIRQEEDKEIFLLCGLFPKNFDIPIEDLTRHVWGLKLLKQVSTLGEARHMTMICLQNLIDANLLIRGHDLGCVKMHNIMLAFVLDEVSTGNHPWVINHGHRFGDQMREHCKRISLTCTGMPEFLRDVKYPNLSLIQLWDGDLSFKIQEDFYDRMENLEVIAYYNMQYPLLPRSLQNLKTLCLRKCVLISDYSFLGDLVNLEVLSLAHCGVHMLPSRIGKLKRLKLLDLTGCVDLHIDDGVLQNLDSLEEIYMRVSDGKAIRFTNANFNELEIASRRLFAFEVEFVEKTRLKNVSFKTLEKFKISMGCLLDKEKDNDKYWFKNTLKIVMDSSSDLLDCKIDVLFNKTEKLHLQVKDMIQLEDVSHNPYQSHSFLNLRDLEVCNCVAMKYLFPISVASGLKKLERLIVSSCFSLETLIYDNGREINNDNKTIEFKKLRFVSLERLPQLVSLFLVDYVVELPQLDELEVDGLPNFTSIYSDKNSMSSLLNSQVSILELKKLRVKSMKNLKQIWATSNDMSTLKEIEVEGCDSIVDLFPTNPMRLLTHLEELRVWNCGSIEVIFNIDLKCTGHEVNNSSLRVIEVYGLKKVREVWMIKGGEDNSHSIIYFTGVESITIRECKMFINVFTPTDAKLQMRALANISIYDCGERGRNKEPDEINVSSVDAPEIVEDEFIVASTSSICIPSFSSNDVSNIILGNNVSSEDAPEVVEDKISVASPSFICIPSSSVTHSHSLLEVVFEISNAATQEHDDTQQQTPLFPDPKDIHLSHMEKMTHVWKWDINSSILLNQPSFYNLTTIHLYECKRIKYLFSPLMANLFCNLKEIHLEACDAMEYVVSNRDDKDKEITASTSTPTYFPNLHSLIFHFLRSLKGIGHDGVQDEFKFSQVSGVCRSLFHYSREIHISWCDGLSEIFDTQSIQNNSRNNSTDNDEGNTLLAYSNIKNLNVPQLSNLTKLVITYCGRLQHVFTFSTLKSLRQLKGLEIKECEAMEVIVKEENKEHGKVVKFPNLKSLELSDLQHLKGFFLGKNDFEWPSLEKVMISKCPQMVVFTNGISTASNLEYIHTSLGKHSLECGLKFPLGTDLHEGSPCSGSTSLEILPWSFHNLIELDMPSNYDPDVKCIIPFTELRRLEKLERIRMVWCFHVNEVFGVETTEEAPNSSVEIPNLRRVELSNLEDLKYIWKGDKTRLLFPNLTTLSIDHCDNLEHVFTSSMVYSLRNLQDLHIAACSNMKVIIKEEKDANDKNSVEIPNLRHVKLSNLKDLKYIWKGEKTIFLFPNLTTLSIDHCENLEHVFTSSMVYSLQNLQGLHINACANMKVIIKDEYDAEEKKTVTLPCLRSLKLEKLQRLKGFWLGRIDYSWPLLRTLEIKECPQLPKGGRLNEIDTSSTHGKISTPANHAT